MEDNMELDKLTLLQELGKSLESIDMVHSYDEMVRYCKRSLVMCKVQRSILLEELKKVDDSYQAIYIFLKDHSEI